MSDTQIAIKVAGEDTQLNASAIQWNSEAETWIKEVSASGKPVRIRSPEDTDTEGHMSGTAVTVVVAEDDDDVEGHAFSIHFPSAQEANDFRRRLMVAGVITASIAVSAAGGAALGTAASGIAANANNASAITSQYDPANLGGTLQAPQAGTGQYDPANLGGTLQAPQAGTGQYDPANLGGTPQTPPVEDE
jgi:hypothetical protein